MTNKEAVEILKDAGVISKIFATDKTYSIPHSEWLRTTFYDFFHAWLQKKELQKWKPNHDCDNFSFLFRTFGQIAHAKSTDPNFSEGVAIGVIFYKKEGRFGHAINVAITEKGVIWIEPQNGKFLDLTQEEIQSIYFVLL